MSEDFSFNFSLRTIRGHKSPLKSDPKDSVFHSYTTLNASLLEMSDENDNKLNEKSKLENKSQVNGVEHVEIVKQWNDLEQELDTFEMTIDTNAACLLQHQMVSMAVFTANSFQLMHDLIHKEDRMPFIVGIVGYGRIGSSIIAALLTNGIDSCKILVKLHNDIDKANFLLKYPTYQYPSISLVTSFSELLSCTLIYTCVLPHQLSEVSVGFQQWLNSEYKMYLSSEKTGIPFQLKSHNNSTSFQLPIFVVFSSVLSMKKLCSLFSGTQVICIKPAMTTAYEKNSARNRIQKELVRSVLSPNSAPKLSESANMESQKEIDQVVYSTRVDFIEQLTNAGKDYYTSAIASSTPLYSQFSKVSDKIKSSSLLLFSNPKSESYANEKYDSDIISLVNYHFTGKQLFQSRYPFEVYIPCE